MPTGEVQRVPEAEHLAAVQEITSDLKGVGRHQHWLCTAGCPVGRCHVEVRERSRHHEQQLLHSLLPRIRLVRQIRWMERDNSSSAGALEEAAHGSHEHSLVALDVDLDKHSVCQLRLPGHKVFYPC